MQIVISREAAYETLKIWVVVAARKAPQRLNGVTQHCSHNSASGAFALLL